MKFLTSFVSTAALMMVLAPAAHSSSQQESPSSQAIKWEEKSLQIPKEAEGSFTEKRRGRGHKKWAIHIEALEQYKAKLEERGEEWDGNMPQNTIEAVKGKVVQLGMWVKNLRHAVKRGGSTLTEAQKHKLDELGLRANAQGDRFVLIKQKTVATVRDEEIHLEYWANNLRQRAKRGGNYLIETLKHKFDELTLRANAQGNRFALTSQRAIEENDHHVDINPSQQEKECDEMGGAHERSSFPEMLYCPPEPVFYVPFPEFYPWNGYAPWMGMPMYGEGAVIPEVKEAEEEEKKPPATSYFFPGAKKQEPDFSYQD